MCYTVMITLIITLLMVATEPITVFDFQDKSTLQNWRIVNDGVMGGLSESGMRLNEEGNPVFKGEVSLENNGGFASVRCYMDPIDIEGKSKAVLRVKGDGKRYQFRIRNDRNTWYSYITYFETKKDEWTDIEIDLSEMYPAFRGRNLDRPNYPMDQIAELSILIGNKVNETFQLELESLRIK